MVKKTAIEERQERLEQGFEALSLEFRNQNADLKEWMQKIELRLPKKHRRRREGSSTVDNGGEDEGDGDSSSTEDSGGSSTRPRRRYPGRKIEIPVFEGDEAYGWLVKVERYFKINGVEEDEMLEAVMIALDGRALNWFQWWEEQHPEPNWEEFKHAVIRRFQPGLVRNPLGPILSVKQTGTVMEYREQFEMLMAPLKKGERVMLESIFLNGLREEIQAELKLHNIRGLNTMMDRALLIEERNKALKDDHEKKNEGSKWKFAASGSGSEPGRNRTFITKGKTTGASGSGGSNDSKAATSSDTKKQVVRKNLSQDELRELSRKGLCFKCGERWGRDHVCKMKHYRIELVDDDYEEEECDEDVALVEPETGEESGEIEVEFKRLLLSLRSSQGMTSNQSFKVWGLINGRWVLILIDSGATSNFISYQLVKELQLALEDTAEYTVEIGNGEKLTHKGVCAGLAVEVQGIPITQNFFLMSLAGTDLVLGMDWLASLGNIKANFKNLEIKWRCEGQKFMIKGEASLSKHQTSFKTMLKAMHQEDECFVVHLYQLQTQADMKQGEQMLNKLLSEYADVFQEPTGLPPHREQDHAINLKPGAAIPNIRPYRYPHYQKDEIEKIVEEMLSAGIIRPSISPFSSPVLLVKKKDGGWRFCIDYRALNKHTIADKFPIPIIDELLDELGSAAVFSKLDLKSGYHQIRMREEDIHKTAFRTHEGHYEYLVMPFGLTNAPSTFQALMNKILKPMMRKYVLVFFDDILVYSKDIASHQEHLSKVLEILRTNKLVANKKKCSFAQKQIEYLGHIISEQGVAADPSKISAMTSWPTPKDVKGLRGFLGLTGYYRRFVKNYGKVAWPLTQQLKKDSFSWTKEAQNAFEELKSAMTTLPVLAVPDFSKEFIVETDASGKGLGAVLMQDKRPVAYMSHTLSNRAQNKSVYERELMAIVIAVQKWRHYLLGRKFTVHTDQRSLRFLTEQRVMGEEQQKWITKLLGYDFDIKYKPGIENKAADALSRKLQYSALSTVQCVEWEGLEEEIQADDSLKKIVQELLIDVDAHEGYKLKNGRLYYKGRIVIPKNSPRIARILDEFHNTASGGHSGVLRTYKRIAGVVYWEGMRKSIQLFVQACEVCQKNKYQTLSPGGLLQPLPIPTQVWSDISMDFVGGLPKAMGVDTIFVVVDRLTKYAHFIALAHPYTAKDVAQVFVKEIVKLHGFPSSIVSDRDRIFISAFWTELFHSAGTKLKMSSAYHPQTDGQTEVVNRCVETYLRCLTGSRPKQWPKWLAWAEYWYNTNYHSSLQMTPFEALYGRSPPVLVRGEDARITVDEVQQLTQERNELLRELRDQLSKAQNRMKQMADKKRREVTFEVGDMVYLKIQPYKLQQLARRVNQKLSPRFYGPFEVLEKIGTVAYKLQLPPESRVHPVFHVSLLKKAVTAEATVQPLPACLNENWELQVSPEDVLAIRKTADVLEVLIKWKDMPNFENSWEDMQAVIDQFPEFNLEDKVKLIGGSIDGNNTSNAVKKKYFDKVYTRRGRGVITP